MNYEIKLKPKAIKDLENLPLEQSKRVLKKLEKFSINLEGDLKKLTNFTPEYRLRIGDYRVLFEIEENTITVYRIIHRKEAYT
jgi:mRNA interferase RelE/StbE